MEQNLRERLISLAREKVSKDDISHDVQHSLRVLALAEEIARDENADIDVIIPAALFHDIVVYPKNDPRGQNETEESAEYTRKLLEGIKEYPQQKVHHVQTAIRQCSFSKGIIPNLLEAKILQDADRLEATGAIAVMRTFSSTGQMQRPFYNPDDPFCNNRKPEPTEYALDLFYSRLLKVKDGMHTTRGKELAKRRTEFLESFLQELSLELEGK